MASATQTARMVLRAPETRSAVPIRVPAPAVRAAQAAAAVRVSQPSDPAEREAERVARRVVGMPAAATAPQVRRFNAVVPATSSALPSALGVGSSAGQPLPRRVRRDMEPRFGADFSSVRVHTGDAAAKASRRLNAAAFTAGRDVFFGRGRFQPEATPGRELIAHELAHTIQQGAAAQQPATVRRSVDTAVRERSAPQVQRLGIQDALDYFAEKAEWIPGFSMLALLLGFNPVSLRAVPRTAANLLRALVQLIPGGPLITQALDNHGIVDRVAAWAEGQLSALGDIGSAIRQSIDEFLDGLGWSDIFDLGDVWARAKRIVTTPIDRIVAFGAGLVSGIVQFIKDAILRPIASLIEPTRGYPLLKAVLGFDPVTGDAVPRNATTLLGGFMTLIGQDEVWQNIQRGNAIAQAWAWFQGALAGLMGFVTQIPTVFLNAFRSLELADIILVPRAFAKIVGVFAGFAGQFVSWGLGTVIKLLEIIFSVVAPGAMGYLRRAGGAIQTIFRNPIGFVMNLVRAAKAGFQRFAGRFFTHLKKGLLDWLTGSLTGVYIPSALSLPEIVKFAFSVLGLTWANLRAKLVTAFGEPAVQAMEKGFDIVKTLVTQGPAAAWEQLKDELIAQKDKVVDGIRDMVIEAVVTKAVPKVVAMFIPGAGFIGAIVSIYDTVMTFVAQLSRIKQVVTSFVDSMMAIAGGAIDAAAARVETTLAGLLSLAINFLAGFAGLGKIANKIKGIIEKIRAPVNKAMDSLIGWVKKVSKSFIDKLAGKDAPPEEKQRRVEKAAAAALAAVSKFSGKAVGEAILIPILGGIKLIHRVTTLIPVKTGEYWSIRAEINPVKTVKTQVKAGKSTAEMEVGYEPHWPLDEFMSKSNAIKAAAEGKTANQAATLGFQTGSKTKQKTTAGLRQGGQERFRAAIHTFIDQITVKKDRDAARSLMGQLQADHQQELQMGGTDTEENMAMIESQMNSQMGGMWRAQLKDLPAETKIAKVKIETKKGTAKGQKHRKSGAASTLQDLLLPYAKALNYTAKTVKDWFAL